MKLKDFYRQDGSKCVIQDGGHQQWKYRVSCTLHIYWSFEGLEYCFWNCTLRPNTHKQYFFQMMGFMSLSCWKMYWLCEISVCHIRDWILLFSRVLCHVVWWICASVLVELDHLHLEGGTRPWRWGQYVSFDHPYISTRLHEAAYQKTVQVLIIIYGYEKCDFILVH